MAFETARWRAYHLPQRCQLQTGSQRRRFALAVKDQREQREQRVNEAIRIREVRVIGAEGEQLGIMPTVQALDLARAQGLDLVEVAPNARPPVAKMLDYGRFKYEQSKREREGRRRQKGSALHQIKMRPNIGRHDMEAKGRTAARLLRNGDKVKISITFRGREITHRDIGKERIQEMLETLEQNDVPTVIEKPISTEGRFMSVIVAEDKVKAKAIAEANAAAESENHAQQAEATS